MRPVVEEKKFKPRNIIYIIIAIICIVAIGFAVYSQFFKEEKLGIIFGITDEEDEEEYNKLKSNFMNIFDNNLNTVNEYTGDIQKIKENKDIILVAFDTQEDNENYTLNLKIPFYNINTDVAKKIDKEIRATFKDKSTSIADSTKKNSNKIIYTVKYKAYLNENILSLIILSELKEGESNQRIIIQAYNYNLDENRECTIDELLNKKQINAEYANDKIEKEINESQEQNTKLQELGYNTNVRDSKSEEYDIKNAQEFFLGDNGNLYVVYPYGNTSFTSEMDVIIFE